MLFKITLFFCFNLIISTVSFAQSVSLNNGRYSNYYHLKYTLNAENFVRPSGSDKYGKREFKYEDGSFEIFLKKEFFPIPRMGNGKYIILRMPSNNDENSKLLFDKIDKILKDKQGELEVIVELNPYVEVLDIQRNKFRLTAPNIFFRMAHGKYINHLNSLK